MHPFVHAPRVAFRTRVVCGDKWALLPSAAGVIDPLLSTGFPLTLLGIGRLLEVLEQTSAGSERDAALEAYAQMTQLELDATEQLVAALYATMSDVALFKRLSLLYFAAASYSEAARRLGRPDLAPGFLLHAHPGFGPELRACVALAMAAPQRPATRLRCWIASIVRSNRSISPACSIAHGATGIRCSPTISSARRRSSTRRSRRSSGCSNAADSQPTRDWPDLNV